MARQRTGSCLDWQSLGLGGTSHSGHANLNYNYNYNCNCTI
ncbi:MAG: hypothetical protein ACJA1Y_000584, partial [Burkholderiaceae bacterium]